MNQPTMKKISLTILTTLACGTLMAQGLRVAPGFHPARPIVPARDTDSAAVVFFNSLAANPVTGFLYDIDNGGYYVWGTSNNISPGADQWIAVPFTSSATGPAKHVKVSVGIEPTSTGTNKFTVGIWSDSGGTFSVPSAALAEGQGTAPLSTGANVASATLAGAGASLTAGVRYWVVCRTNSTTQITFSGIWYASNAAQIGGNLPSALTGWFQFSGFTGAATVSS
jgi:hypothetical protein